MEIPGLTSDENAALDQEIARRVAVSAADDEQARADYAAALEKYEAFMKANPTRSAEEFPAPAAPADPLTTDAAATALVREAFAPVLAAIAARAQDERVSKFAALSQDAQDQLLARVT